MTREEFDQLPISLTVDQAAKALGIGRGAAYEGVRTGNIPSVRIGRTIRVPKAGLAELLSLLNPETHACPFGSCWFGADHDLPDP